MRLKERTLESTQALTYNVKTNLSDAELVKNMFPQFDDPRKAEFLVLRTCLTIAEARSVVGITIGEYNQWRESDPSFLDWDINHLHRIQGPIAATILKARFMRNVFLTLHIDSELLAERAFMEDGMSKEHREEAAEAKKRYGPQGIAQMLKILDDSADPEAGNSHVKVELDIKIDGDQVESYGIKKAKARALLDWAAQKHADDAIEGEYKDLGAAP